MTIWELLLRSQHPTGLLGLSREYADLPILSWRFDRQELLQVEIEAPALYRRFLRDLTRDGRALHRTESLGPLRILLLDEPDGATPDLWQLALEHHLVQAPPTLYYEGWGYYRLIGFDEPDLKAFVRHVRTAAPTELFAKRLVPLSTLVASVTSDQVTGTMTLRQTETLLRAVDAGYFRAPRRAKTSDLARAAGVSRTTFEEHLRKAENHLIDALVPLLRVHLTGTAPSRLVPDLLAAWGIAPGTPEPPRPVAGAPALAVELP